MPTTTHALRCLFGVASFVLNFIQRRFGERARIIPGLLCRSQSIMAFPGSRPVFLTSIGFTK
jgi:hypothetical protein